MIPKKRKSDKYTQYSTNIKLERCFWLTLYVEDSGGSLIWFSQVSPAMDRLASDALAEGPTTNRSTLLMRRWVSALASTALEEHLVDGTLSKDWCDLFAVSKTRRVMWASREWRPSFCHLLEQNAICFGPRRSQISFLRFCNITHDA